MSDQTKAFWIVLMTFFIKKVRLELLSTMILPETDHDLELNKLPGLPNSSCSCTRNYQNNQQTKHNHFLRSINFDSSLIFGNVIII